MCAVLVLAYLWHVTHHKYIPMLAPFFEVQLYDVNEVKKIQFLTKTQPYTTNEEERSDNMYEEKTPFLLETLPYTTDGIPSLPKTLPYVKYLKRKNDIQQALWITHLYQFLHNLNKSISPQVNMVFGDSDHMDLVLNWIIAAHVRLNPPLHNIMVLSLDQTLCDFLESKKLPVACIAVPPESFLESTGSKSWELGVKSRFIVLRLINFWGYDVASYDSDAVLLRNPQPLYDSHPDVKLFAGSGTYPYTISRKWGFIFCAGVIFVRSHPSTGTYECMHLNLVNIQSIFSYNISSILRKNYTSLKKTTA